MISAVKQSAPKNVLPISKQISPRDLISILSGICENRYHAINAYPSAYGASRKFDAIARIRTELAAARLMLNDRQIIKTCLRLENHFLTLAPRSTRKLFDTYNAKVDDLMNACRTFLGLIKQ